MSVLCSSLRRWWRLSRLPAGLARCLPGGLVAAWLLGALPGVAGCGGTVMVEVRPIEAPRQVPSAPPQSAEERDGEVPPLRGLHDRRSLVPKTLVPPAPPGDPEPGF